MNATLTTGEVIQYQDDPIAEGGEGRFYRSLDGRRGVKIYWPHMQTPELRRTLDRITFGKYNVPTRTSGIAHLFAWPDGIIVQQDGSPTMGISMPYVPNHRPLLHHVTRKWWEDKVPQEEKMYGWIRRLTICYRLAVAVRLLNNNGLAHSDLSPKNVLVDMKSASTVLIDCDGLVVPDVQPAKVLGTPWFMAPEIVSSGGLTLPSILTDRHSLAVLIYMTLLMRHPLKGPKIHDPHNTEDDDILAQGEGALYVEHPTDPSNHLRPPGVGASALSPKLRELFHSAFVTHLHNPSGRPKPTDWEAALKRIIDRTVPCANPDCRLKSFALPEQHMPQCPWCKTPYRDPSGTFPLLRFYRSGNRPGKYELDDWDMVGFNGRILYEYHARADADPRTDVKNVEVARIHHQGSGWFLTNTARDVTFKLLSDPTGASGQIPPGSSCKLDEGTRILLGQSEDARMFLVTLVHTA